LTDFLQIPFRILHLRTRWLPFPLTITADFAYVRLHGPGPGKYQESYSTDRLRRWSKQVEEWAKNLAAIYIYFDNDQAGYAAQNA